MGTEGALDLLLRSGREALAAADWETARSFFERARERDESAEALDGLSEVAHFGGEYDRAIELKERAFAAYVSSGQRVEAADMARWLAFLYASLRGDFPAASGWMGRAESLLDAIRGGERTHHDGDIPGVTQRAGEVALEDIGGEVLMLPAADGLDPVEVVVSGAGPFLDLESIAIVGGGARHAQRAGAPPAGSGHQAR